MLRAHISPLGEGARGAERDEDGVKGSTDEGAGGKQLPSSVSQQRGGAARGEQEEVAVGGGGFEVPEAE